MPHSPAHRLRRRATASWIASIALHGVLLAILGWTLSGAPDRGDGGSGAKEGLDGLPGGEAGCGDGDGECQVVHLQILRQPPGKQSVVDAAPPAEAPRLLSAPEPWSQNTQVVAAVGSVVPEEPSSAVPANALVSADASPTVPSENTGGSSGHGGTPLAGFGNPSHSGAGRTGLFGVEGEGKKFVFVVDRSGSMGEANHNVLKAVKRQLLGCLSRLDAVHQFQIVFYNDRPISFSRSGAASNLVFATGQNKTLAARFIDSILPEGGTEHEKALETALQMRPNAIFLLTDAEEPRLTPAQLAAVRHRAQGTIIHVIEFGRGPQSDPDNFLVQLARQNGGRHGYVDITSLD
jgi:hypothetical protein